MKELQLPESTIQKLEHIYTQLEELYSKAANKIKFTCTGCPDNCCDSYFLHYTYLEWAYLHIGLKNLAESQQQLITERAINYQRECHRAEEAGERPQILCPLNEEGLCIAYKHRLLVCRTHGVPATMTRPDGQKLAFPGCFRCQALVKKKFLHQSEAPHVERTPFLRQLALLENELLDNNRDQYPRVRMTIADMIVAGPPSL